jgi:hypothetical protein
VKEPKAVIEAKTALRKQNWRMVPLITAMSLGWIPMLPLESAGVNPVAFMSVYMLLTVMASGYMAWDAHKTKWAKTLVTGWESHLAQLALKESFAEMEPGDSDVPSAVFMGRIREHLELGTRALAAAETAY